MLLALAWTAAAAGFIGVLAAWPALGAVGTPTGTEEATVVLIVLLCEARKGVLGSAFLTMFGVSQLLLVGELR